MSTRQVVGSQTWCDKNLANGMNDKTRTDTPCHAFGWSRDEYLMTYDSIGCCSIDETVIPPCSVWDFSKKKQTKVVLLSSYLV